MNTIIHHTIALMKLKNLNQINLELKSLKNKIPMVYALKATKK